MTLKHKPYPDWLYNSMPFAYLAVGVVTTLVVPHTLGTLIGLASVGVGTAIWISRYRYRRAFALAQEHMDRPTLFGSEDLPEGGLVQMSWNKSLETGHPVIDGQHRRLFGLANEAIDTLLSKGPKADEETLLTQLIEQLQTHFITEETLLARAFDPRLEEHRAEHKALLAAAKAMLKRFHDGEVISKDLVAFLSNNVISDHLLREDVSMVGALT
jgi:hemerythrin-like metal-binding protein